MFVEYGSKRTTVHTRWPPFNPFADENNVNRFLLLVVPKDSLR
jgi:hypothetical protein